MKRIEFLDSFRIDDGPLDDQHRQLFQLINDLAEALEAGALERCRAVAEEFIKAARRHFQWEEAFLRDIGFPHVDDHAHYHDRLLRLAEQARESCTEEAVTRDHEACFDQLVSVFVDDVVRGDLTFKSYLEDRVGA